MNARHGALWLDALADALARDARAVLVVVAAAKGSTPREAGAAIVVSQGACVGSIGGGHLEYEAIRIARDALVDAAPRGNWLIRYPLAARLGQCCGGVATLAFSRLDADAGSWVASALACSRAGTPFAIVARIGAGGADMRLVVTEDDVRGSLGEVGLDSRAIALARARLASASDGAAVVRFADDEAAPLLIQVERADGFPILLFGNGHVGRALVGVLSVVPAQLRWIDPRLDDFPAQVPANVEVVASDAPEDEIADAPAGAFVIVTTHSHALDFTLIEAAVARDDWRYLGLIGSRSKRAQFERRLAARGVAPETIARVRCPIGATSGIRSKHPGAIAIAIAAELLLAREAVARDAPASTIELVNNR